MLDLGNGSVPDPRGDPEALTRLHHSPVVGERCDRPQRDTNGNELGPGGVLVDPIRVAVVKLLSVDPPGSRNLRYRFRWIRDIAEKVAAARICQPLTMSTAPSAEARAARGPIA